MERRRAEHVIAGIDESEQAAQALEFAAIEAKLREGPLQIVCAVDVPTQLSYGRPAPVDEWVAETRSQVDEIVDDVRARYPALTVAGGILVGRASSVLVDHSTAAQLIAVGSRGRSTPGILLGSVSHAVAAHARCPVAVVKGEVRAPQEIVLGNDGSESAAAAAEWAFEEAERRDLPLRLVSAMDPAKSGVPWFRGPTPSVDTARQGAAMELEQAITPLRERHPSVDVSTEIVRGRPAPALIEYSTPDHLLVLGSRGRGAFRSMVLGSVSQNVLHQAGGTTIIVHPRSTRPIPRTDDDVQAKP